MTTITNNSPLLQWELDWVDKYQSSYDSELHAHSVKGNIVKRYKINALNKEIADLEKKVKKLNKLIDKGKTKS